MRLITANTCCEFYFFILFFLTFFSVESKGHANEQGGQCTHRSSGSRLCSRHFLSPTQLSNALYFHPSVFLFSGLLCRSSSVCSGVSTFLCSLFSVCLPPFAPSHTPDRRTFVRIDFQLTPPIFVSAPIGSLLSAASVAVAKSPEKNTRRTGRDAPKCLLVRKKNIDGRMQKRWILSGCCFSV